MSRLALEVKPGVFVADINARVREKIWQRISQEWMLDAIMLFSTNSEQSYRIYSNGSPDREVMDFDGLQLLSKPVKKKNELLLKCE